MVAKSIFCKDNIGHNCHNLNYGDLVMKGLILIAMVFCLFSCKDVAGSKKGEVVYFEVEEKMFDKYINQKDLPSEPNYFVDKRLVNDSYPFEIILYKNNKFFYNLPNLGEGTGKFWYENGGIRFFAKRSLFDMHMDLKAKSKNAETVILKFKDRFGPNALEMTKHNF